MSAQGLLSHIEALRKMILEMLVIFVILLILSWWFVPYFLDFLHFSANSVARQSGAQFELQYFALMEPFLVELKSGMLLAFILGLPLYFWRFWKFLSPALYTHERRFLLTGAIAAWLLFVAGAALGIFGVLPLLVGFSLSFAREGLTPLIGLNNFVGLLISIALAFGAMFELPIVLLALLKAGIIELKTLQTKRPHVLVIILFLAAFLTPPDIISQLMLGIPTYLLFEATLIVGKFITSPRNEERPEESSEESGSQTDENEEIDDEQSDYIGSAEPNRCYHRQKRRRTAPLPKRKPRKIR